MVRFSLLLCITALLIAVAGSENAATGQSSANTSIAPVYTADGKLVFPPNYREWIYLTTGLDMDYSPTVNLADHSMFDNVFVNPDAYKAFVATGKWPDKTVFVLEGRVAGSKGSINKAGHYQTTEIMSRSIPCRSCGCGYYVCAVLSDAVGDRPPEGDFQPWLSERRSGDGRKEIVDRGTLRTVILSEAKDLLSWRTKKRRSFASLRMTA